MSGLDAAADRKLLGTIPVEYYTALSDDRIVPPEDGWALDPDTRPSVSEYLTEVKKADGSMKDWADGKLIYDVPRADWCRSIGKDGVSS